jgi:hypothetical protein
MHVAGGPLLLACSLVLVGCSGNGKRAGSAGGPDGVATGDCVDVSHVDARQVDDLRVVGTGFEVDEGRMLRIVVTHGEPTYGLGETQVVAGAFELLLPGTLGDYTGIGIYVDRVRDSACNPGDELLWQKTTGPATGDTRWEVSPDTLMVFEQAGPCNINGIFDLTRPLPCPREL